LILKNPELRGSSKRRLHNPRTLFSSNDPEISVLEMISNLLVISLDSLSGLNIFVYNDNDVFY